MAVIATGLLAARAEALSLDVHPFVSGGYSYDSNVFRTRSAAEAQALTGQTQRGDSYYRAAIGGKLTLTESLQKLQVEGEYGRDRYEEYRELDGSHYKLKGRADLAFGSALGATLTGSRDRALQSYSGRNDTAASFQTNTLGAAEFYYRLTPRISIKPEIDVLRYRYSLDTQADSNLDENARQLSLEYGREKLSAVGVKVRDLDGKFPNRDPALDGTGREREYTQRTYAGYLNYLPSGLSQLKLEAGYTQRRHDDASVPNYSGATGRLSYRRVISGKTSGEIQLFRDLQSINEVGINYVQETGVGAVVDYAWSVKTAFLLGYQYYEDKFLGSSAQDPANDGRKDRFQTVRAGIEYAPADRFLITPQFRYEDRSSTREDRTYNYGLFAVDLKYTY